MKTKDFFKKMFFPNLIFLVFVVISATILLICSFTVFKLNFLNYICYCYSFYALLIFSLRVKDIIACFKKLAKKNKYINMYFTNKHLRTNISLYISLLMNFIYSIFQLTLGIIYHSFWFYSMFGYYLILFCVRLYLARHTLKYQIGENLKVEYQKYLFSGILLLIMNVFITVIIFFLAFLEKTFYYHEIVTIGLATYTFYSFIMAIINYIKYKKYNSPVYQAIKSISLVSTSVSVLTLTVSMLQTFGNDESIYFKKTMILCVGIVISCFVILIAIKMIVQSFQNKNFINGQKL